jgi:hypothetical protein
MLNTLTKSVFVVNFALNSIVSKERGGIFTLYYGSAVTHVVRLILLLMFCGENLKFHVKKVCENLPHAKVILLKPSDKIVKPKWMYVKIDIDIYV